MEILTESEIRAMNEALDDEYKAFATYDQVITDFGEILPFSHIREAEERHIHSLRVLFGKYGLEIPENPWTGKAPRYASVQLACEAGVEAEKENDAMYERLIGQTERADLIAAFRRLQEASKERHLPAFQRCVERPGLGQGPGAANIGGRGQGRGAGPGMGGGRGAGGGRGGGPGRNRRA